MRDVEEKILKSLDEDIKILKRENKKRKNNVLQRICSR